VEIHRLVRRRLSKDETKAMDLFSRSQRENTKLQIITHSEAGEDEGKKEQEIRVRYSKLFSNVEPELEIDFNGFEGYIENHAR